MNLQIDIARLTSELERLASFSASAPPSVTRIVFSQQDLEARTWLKQLFAEANLELRHDSVGNTFARWYGAEPHLPPIATGSHIDAIPDAGAYDGTVGVLGAIEAVRALRRSGFSPRRSVEIILFTSEEPTRFGVGCLGSRLLSGTLEPQLADALRDPAGAALAQIREQAGFFGDLATVPLKQGCYRAFVELHIEQGPLLERDSIHIGAVTHIAAPASMRVVFVGEGGHAGAVLMPFRRDALLGGAEFAIAVEATAKSTGAEDSVATTGIFEVVPGAVNSIPSRANLAVDVRDTDEIRRNGMVDRIMQSARDIGMNRGLEVSIDVVNADPPATCDPAIVETIVRVAKQTEKQAVPMVSRAYHDTLFMARIAPVSMIFIPCRNGVSHRPDEYASPVAIADGVEVLAYTLAQLSSE